MSGSQEAIAPFSGHAQASISSTQAETAEIEAAFGGTPVEAVQAVFDIANGSLDYMNGLTVSIHGSLDRIVGSLEYMNAAVDRLETKLDHVLREVRALRRELARGVSSRQVDSKLKAKQAQIGPRL